MIYKNKVYIMKMIEISLFIDEVYNILDEMVNKNDIEFKSE